MTNVMSIVAIILAAGQGHRLGGRKSRLIIEGEPLVLRHIKRFAEAGVRAVVVAHPDDSELVVDPNVTVVISREAYQAGSLSIGVRALPNDVAHVLITPVDALPASVATLDSLNQALASPNVIAATPVFQGRRGHPVAVRRSALGAYDGSSTPPPLREMLAALGARRAEIVVEDPNVVTDLDDAAQVIAATGAPPRFT